MANTNLVGYASTEQIYPNGTDLICNPKRSN